VIDLKLGTYRVGVLVDLFNILADFHNFEVGLAVLTLFEVACVQCRIGFLYYFNPFKSEGFHTTDLSLREERVVAKMKAALSFVEPAGENWVREWKHSALYCCSHLFLLSIFCYVLQNLLCWSLFSVLSESQSIQFE
jgi:hypothetical protein